MHRFLFRRKHYAAFKAENRDYVDTESSQLKTLVEECANSS